MPWYIPALLTAAGWGLLYVLSETVTKGITKTTYLLLSTFVQLFIFGFISRCQDRLESDLGYLWKTPAALASLVAVILISVCSNYLSLTAIQLKNAASAAAVETTYPLWAALFAYLIFNQSQLTPVGLIGTALVMIGVCLIVCTGS